MKSPTLLACAVALCCSLPCSAADVRVDLQLARRSIVRGDIQIILVTVSNTSDKPVKLDYSLSPVVSGPNLELQSGTGAFEHVQALGQGSCSCVGETTVPAGESVAELMTLAVDVLDDTGPIFSKAGKYRLRASVSVGGAEISSEAQPFEVVDIGPIEWSKNVSCWEVHDMIRKPTQKFLDSLPADCLFKEWRDLTLLAQDFVKSPEEVRPRWLAARKKATPLMADDIGLSIATQFYSKKEYELALEELSRMKAQPQRAVFYKAECKRHLALPK